MKKLLIILSIIIGAVGITLIVFVLTLPKLSTPAVSIAPSFDHSKDYGACTLIDTATIKSALGTSANTLQTPVDMGIANYKLIGNKLADIKADSQLCVYAFATGGSAANDYLSNNAFSTQVVTYRKDTDTLAVINQLALDSDAAKTDVSGHTAFYSANTVSQGPNATYSFKLFVFIGNKEYVYAISQPVSHATFTADSGKTILTSLARVAH